MTSVSTVFRRLSAIALTVGWCATTVISGSTGAAKAAGFESLMVPSPSMGRSIPVAFLAGGPHAAYLLDGFNAGPDVSNWVTAGNGFNTLAGKGISVVAPAGGAYSMYTNWEQDGSKQWESFLSTELPDWLAANTAAHSSRTSIDRLFILTSLVARPLTRELQIAPVPQGS